MKEAVLVVDMIHDFVYGKLGSENAQDMVPRLSEFLKEAESEDVLIIYAQDSHEEDDPEMDLWGQHAMSGGKGSETVDELRGYEDELVKKRSYDAFHESRLQGSLEEHSIQRLILCGVSTDICVQNTAAGAFFRGYDIMVLEDCTAALEEEKHEYALDYMKNTYGAEITDSKDVLERIKSE